MKNTLISKSFFLVLLAVFLCSAVYSQKEKKDKVRLKVAYVKIMDGEVFLNLKATAKVGDENINVSNIELIITNELEEESIELGTVTTNMNGASKFVLKNLETLSPDSSNTYTIDVSFKGNEAFSKASKSVSFKDASIEAHLVTKDSINYITATLKDIAKDSLLAENSLKVQLQRLFRPLLIGKEFNITDENGTIIVPIESGIPGVDGNLTFEVVLNESDEYGTVKALVQAPIGEVIVDESTFDERTMWSPRNKTPLFLLIFPNLLILAVWGIIFYLIANLFKLSKS